MHKTYKCLVVVHAVQYVEQQHLFPTPCPRSCCPTRPHPTQVWIDAMQTVQYIQPQHAAQLSQAELVVIDEAAAIPLPVVKALLGPYLVFLCSTVNGYEGTGRSLSLKLIEQLRTEVKCAR